MAEQYEVRITDYAKHSMREIASYIAYDLASPRAAVHLLNLLHDQISKLDSMPFRIGLTPEEPWASMGIHRMVVKNYYVYFWIDTEHLRVQVTDVTYARQDQIPKLQNMPIQ